jgi:hypothetical protein
MKKHAAAITMNHEVSFPSMEYYAKINNLTRAMPYDLKVELLLHRFREIMKPATI